MDQRRLLELAGVDFLTEKLDPEQEFPIATVSRKHIADMVNHAIEEKRLHVTLFEPNDPRLTPKFCKAFSEHMMNWHDGFRDNWLDNNETTEQVADFVGEVGQQYLRTIPQKPKTMPAEKK